MSWASMAEDAESGSEREQRHGFPAVQSAQSGLLAQPNGGDDGTVSGSLQHPSALRGADAESSTEHTGLARPESPDAVKNNPPKTGAKGITPEVRAKAFTRWDTTKNNILTLDEYKTGLKGQNDLEARFRGFDTDGDGELTRDEFVP